MNRNCPTGKNVYRTEREALNDLKRVRHGHSGENLRALNAYQCRACGWFHLGHSHEKIRKQRRAAERKEDRRLRERAEQAGRAIAADERRAAQKVVRELAPIVAAEREWLRLLADQAQSHAENLRAIHRMVDEHFSRRDST